MTKKLLFLISEDSYFISHRFDLALAIQVQTDFEVAIATRCSTHQASIEQAGIRVFPLQYFGRGHQSLLNTFLGLKELYGIYRSYQPTVVHHVAIKPVVFGSFIAWVTRVPNILNALGGLGYLFTASATLSTSNSLPSSTLPTLSRSITSSTSSKPPSRLQQIKKTVYRKVFCKVIKYLSWLTKSTLILQNTDDKEELIKHGCFRSNQVIIIPGCGIRPEDFPVTPFPAEPPVIITCVSRMLWDKGIGELIAAAQLLQQDKLPIKVVLYGMPDSENPASVPEQQLQDWHQSGVIEWRGFCNNVAQAYADCHIAVLPSYREGLPKSLLEAACCGRPMVTTDVPGCREIVTDGYNGYLVPARDAAALYQALRRLAENAGLRTTMGKHARQTILDKFNVDDIISRFVALL